MSIKRCTSLSIPQKKPTQTAVEVHLGYFCIVFSTKYIYVHLTAVCYFTQRVSKRTDVNLLLRLERNSTRAQPLPGGSPTFGALRVNAGKLRKVGL